tara:strand:+ start:73 stop:486 length:414 start_codon:yes stop_codon:yes gene_type:complete
MKLIEKLEQDKKQKDGNQPKNEYKIKCMEQSMAVMTETIDEMKKTISRMKSNFDAHINRQFTEIRVIEKNGKWGDYSGTFYLDSDDEKELVLEKAKNHFKKHFKNGTNHSDKKLGLFHFSPRAGKQLIEEMKTNPNK